MLDMPKGFRFFTVSAGLKYKDRPDIGVILSEGEATAAGTFTQNVFAAPPVHIAKEMLGENATMRGVVVNAGQANACTGEAGFADCREALRMTGEALGVPADKLLPASTGVIGARIPLDKWQAAMPELAASEADAIDFAQAVMTTDAFIKVSSSTVLIGDKEAQVLGVAKGAGMICPNMATLLGFILTDAAVEQALWQDILGAAVSESFNRISVDGDTSTNDSILALASGASGLTVDERSKNSLSMAVTKVCRDLAHMIVEDAEGGTKVAHIHVYGANDDAGAEAVARTVGHSPLVKTALYGQDANWGRIVAAVGRSGVEFDPMDVSVSIAGVTVFENGAPVPGDYDALLKGKLSRKEIAVSIRLGYGQGRFNMMVSDLSHEYVSINADYRS